MSIDSKSKHYFDCTRNMSEEQIKNSPCGSGQCVCCKQRKSCPREKCICKDVKKLNKKKL